MFHDRMRKAIAMRGWSQCKLSEMTGISTVTLSKYVRGENEPSADRLRVIAEALGVSADWLLGLTDQREVNRKITNAQKFKQIFHISVEEVQPKDLSWWQEEYKDEIQV